MGSCNSPGDVALPEFNILLVGPRRTGKSSTGNTLLGLGPVFKTRGSGVSTAASGIVAGRNVRVVDAQGWSLSDKSVPQEEKIELLRALSLCGLGGPHVVLLVIPLLDFTEPERRAVERRMKILTSTVWRHTMVLFTCADLLRRGGHTVEEHIQSGGPALHWLIEKCHHRYHVFDNKAAVAGKHEGSKQEVRGGGKKQERIWRKKNDNKAGRRSIGGEADERKGGEQGQVRELLGKVESLVQENGGWHFSLHMYRKLEEEWSRKEQELRARLETEMAKTNINIESEQEPRLETKEEGRGGKSLRNEQQNMEKYVEKRMNEGEDEKDRAQLELKRLCSEEDGWDTSSDGGGEREKGTEVKMVAPCWPNVGQRSALSPIRGLA